MIIIGIVLSVVRRRLLLLAAVHARRLRAPLLRGLTAASPPTTAGRASSARIIVASSPAPRPWRSDRSPSRRFDRRSSAPQSRSLCRAGGHRRLPCDARARAHRRPLRGWREAFAVVGAILSAARRLCACRCSSRRPSGSSVAEARLVFPGGRDQRGVSQRRHRRSVGYRRDDRLVHARAERAACSASRSAPPPARRTRVTAGAPVVQVRSGRAASFLSATVSFSSPGKPDLLCRASTSATSSPEDAVRRADHMASPWLDLAEGPAAPRSPEPQRRRHDFLPLGVPPRGACPWGPRFAHSSRGKKVPPPPSSAALRPASGCVVDRLRPPDRHRGRGGRGLETSKEK